MSPMAGGTTGMEMRNISGPEITTLEFTPVSAEPAEIASTPTPNATAMRSLQRS
jgi:hypothetical protein